MLSNPLAGPLRALRRVAVWAVLACLAIGLPLQALSSTLAGMLGSRHAHQSAPSQEQSDDPMAGWKDFRRANYEHAGVREPLAHADAHDHAHKAGLRHHHAPDDADVVDLEALTDGDGAPAGSPYAGAAFVMAANTGLLEPAPRAAAAGDDVWRLAIARSFSTPFPSRIDRPPRPA
ncbi:hypothetical protein [Variovorax sp. PvP013]|uniref:hypothetical protein n=1 Tax=Variovorax sp. PvP013 TaxID=3156435 RepID=UPI003D218B50